MKFKIDQQTLSKSLNIVSKAVTNRTTLPILNGIHLNLNNEGILTMSSSDTEITINTEIKIENNDFEPGSIVVMAKLFGDIIRKLPNDEIEMYNEKENLMIKCMNSEFNIVGFPADEFPKINSSYEEQESIEINKILFKDMIRKTAFAASTDETKGIINGILIEIENEHINLVAIDGYRMAINREKVDGIEDTHIIISAKYMNDINKILSETNDEKIKIILSKNIAVFIFENTRVMVKIMTGEFIKYKEILPKNNKIDVVIDREELLSSIERASLLSKEGKNNLIKFKISDTTMNINSRSEEGNVNEEVSVEKTGEDIEIGFNAKYVLDVLKSIEDEKIKMCFNTSITPCLIEPIDDNRFDYLILPVRITNN